MFFSVLCLLCLGVRLFICALWSFAWKRLTSLFSFVVSNCVFATFRWYPGSWWYLIVSIPDLCILTYFKKQLKKVKYFAKIGLSSNKSAFMYLMK